MKWQIIKKHLKNNLLIIVGSILYAIAISLFLDPNQLAPGGLTGIVIMISYYVSIKVGTLVFILNIPIMILGIYKFGLRFFASTVYAIILTSVFTNILAPYGPITEERLLAAGAGGALLAIGIGLTFKAGATTGGVDIIVRLIKLKFRHIKTGKLFLIFDVIVVSISAYVFKNIDVALFAGVAVLISSIVFDIVLYGADGAKLVYVISEHQELIAKRFLEELEVGVTFINGSGAYTDNKKKILMCAMRKQLLPQAQDIVNHEDSNAFMIVSSATEIFGEGFKRHDSERI